MNLNNLARVIAKRESGKQQISIGQIKEVLKITLEELGKYDDAEVIKTINKYR